MYALLQEYRGTLCLLLQHARQGAEAGGLLQEDQQVLSNA